LKKLRYVLIIWLLIAVACNLPVGNSTPDNPQTEVDGAAAQMAGGAPDQGGGGNSYPAQPEAVVQEFLTAYQVNPVDMKEYLSTTLATSGSTPEQIADLSGPIEGFGVQSAAVINNPPSARVAVDLQIGGQPSSRIFWLVQEGDLWVIERVEK
jgi:hypothetical protein